MTITVQKLQRSFAYNGIALPDPGSELSPEHVRDVYSAPYPEITTASIEGPEYYPWQQDLFVRSPYTIVDGDGDTDLAVAVFVGTGVSGSQTAGPVLEAFLRAAADAVLPRHGHAGYDYVLVGRTTTQDRAFAALCDDLQIALKNIHQQRQQRKTVITRT